MDEIQKNYQRESTQYEETDDFGSDLEDDDD